MLIGSYTGSGSGTKTINVTAAVNATQGKVLFYLNNIIDFNGDRKNLILSGVKVVE